MWHHRRRAWRPHSWSDFWDHGNKRDSDNVHPGEINKARWGRFQKGIAETRAQAKTPPLIPLLTKQPTQPDTTTGFWGLNAGLMGMIVVTLVPIGVLQAVESFNNGFWSARSLDFNQQPIVKTLLWLRMAPDSVFIVIGALPIVAGAVYGFLRMRPLREPVAVKETVEEEEFAGV